MAGDEHEPRRCQHLKDDGERCRAWSLRGRDVCSFHSKSKEERLAMARRGMQASVLVRRENAIARQRGTAKHRPDSVTLALACHAMRHLLEGKLPDAEPSLEQRALGLELFAAIFRQPDREEAFRLLRQAAPGVARGLEPDREALRRFEGAREQLLDDVLSGRVQLGEFGEEIRTLLRLDQRETALVEKAEAERRKYTSPPEVPLPA